MATVGMRRMLHDALVISHQRNAAGVRWDPQVIGAGSIVQLMDDVVGHEQRVFYHDVIGRRCTGQLDTRTKTEAARGDLLYRSCSPTSTLPEWDNKRRLAWMQRYDPARAPHFAARVAPASHPQSETKTMTTMSTQHSPKPPAAASPAPKAEAKKAAAKTAAKPVAKKTAAAPAPKQPKPETDDKLSARDNALQKLYDRMKSAGVKRGLKEVRSLMDGNVLAKKTLVALRDSLNADIAALREQKKAKHVAELKYSIRFVRRLINHGV